MVGEERHKLRLILALIPHRMCQLNGEVRVVTSLGSDLQSDKISFVLFVTLDLPFRDPMCGEVADHFPVGALISVCDAAAIPEEHLLMLDLTEKFLDDVVL